MIGLGSGIGILFGIGTLAVATLLGLLWRNRQGRIMAPRTVSESMPRPCEQVSEPTPRPCEQVSGPLPRPVLAQLDAAAAVTLLQLTTPICARCPQARALLTELAAATSGVRHAELDLAEHPGLAGELGVRSTPTTLVISRTGHELFRVAGVPRRAELLSALIPHL